MRSNHGNGAEDNRQTYVMIMTLPCSCCLNCMCHVVTSGSYANIVAYSSGHKSHQDVDL